MSTITRLWPEPDGTALDDAMLAAHYATGPDPALRVNLVSSIDGAVALDGLSEGLSGPADKRVFGVLRMLCDALLVGAGTLRSEGYRALRLAAPGAPWRLVQGRSGQPTLVVVSGSLDLNPAQGAFADAPVRPIVITCERAPAERRAALRDVAEVVACGDDAVDLAATVHQLRRRGLAQLLCEGGPHLFGALTAAGLVDEVCLTVAPLLTGAGAGRITAGEPAPPQPMSLRHILTGDDALLLRYARR